MNKTNRNLPKIRASIKCPQCSGKVMEGQTFKDRIEVSCWMCGWRIEPLIVDWDKSKNKVYLRLLSERSR
jgi:hypothetical protein